MERGWVSDFSIYKDLRRREPALGGWEWGRQDKREWSVVRQEGRVAQIPVGCRVFGFYSECHVKSMKRF